MPKSHVFKKWSALFAAAFILASFSTDDAAAAPCMKVTLTGTMGGPPTYNGLAGAGTLVRYGDSAKGCNQIRMLFDAGRGTNMRLSQVGVRPWMLHAVFLTHIHGDHTEGLPDVIINRWHFDRKKRRLDVICSEAVKSPKGFTISCRRFAKGVAAAFELGGETAQRMTERKWRKYPPSDIVNVLAYKMTDEARPVWGKGKVSVTAIRSTHIPGHTSYRVDTPAGSVVIGGDAGNDTRKPPRKTSTSTQVEKLAKGADVIVHSSIHPVMAPGKGSKFPPPVYFRQSTAKDLGAMAERAGVKNLMLTHMIPPLGAKRQGPFVIPGGALSKGDWEKAVRDSGFKGVVHVGEDLLTIQLPANK